MNNFKYETKTIIVLDYNVFYILIFIPLCVLLKTLHIIILNYWYFVLHILRDTYLARLVRQGSPTNPLSWKGNIGYRKSALNCATQWHAFRNCFSFKNGFSCILK